jgi:hypothetical protein
MVELLAQLLDQAALAQTSARTAAAHAEEEV